MCILQIRHLTALPNYERHANEGEWINKQGTLCMNTLILVAQLVIAAPKGPRHEGRTTLSDTQMGIGVPGAE
jgi:hypothetical protein